MLNKETDYFIVNSQKEHYDILDYLESLGEKIKKGFAVVSRWKYILFDGKEWRLHNAPKSNLLNFNDFKNSNTSNLQFEVGKWYKINNCWWGKYQSDTNELIFGSESISSNGKYYGNSFNATKKEQNNNFKLLTDLTEIQQYLPEGHPDKIQVNEFKAGDYIVQLHESSNDIGAFKKDYCYKQRKNDNYLCPINDGKGSDKNGWTRIFFTDKHTWRYATLQEIAEYDKLGKPYDVTTLYHSKLNEFDTLEWTPKIGDWVVILKAFTTKNIIGKCVQIKNITKDTYEIEGTKGFSISRAFEDGFLRKALPHEIPNNPVSGINEINKTNYPLTPEKAFNINTNGVLPEITDKKPKVIKLETAKINTIKLPKVPKIVKF